MYQSKDEVATADSRETSPAEADPTQAKPDPSYDPIHIEFQSHR